LAEALITNGIIIMLKKCCECRSEMAIDVSIPFESSGANEQVISIRCTGEKKAHCPMGIACSFDADITCAIDVEREMIAVWNRMAD
jgi:hypothetical protein